MAKENYIDAELLFFGKSRDLAGMPHTRIQLSTNPQGKAALSRIHIEIFHAFPSLQSIEDTCILAIDKVYCTNADEEIELREGSEIAVIPPLSGG